MRHFSISALSTISIILANNSFNINPIFFSEYKLGGGDWHYEDKNIFINGFGTYSTFNNKNFKIESKYLQLYLSGNINDKILNFSPDQSFPYLRKSLDADGYSTEIATMKISYENDIFKMKFGKYDNFWGPGKRALHVSNKAPSYPQFGFDWRINNRLKLIYFHGILQSELTDTSQSKYYKHVWDSEDLEYENNVGRRVVNINKFIAAHRIEWHVNEKIRLVANESVIYGTRGFDFHYLMALIPFLQIEDYLGDLDNIQMGAEIIYSLSTTKQIYICFYMDELTPERIFSDNNHNWFGWQFGSNMNNIFYLNDKLTIEYNWTDHRLYKHKFEINDFYTHNSPIGFWIGPHAEELFFEYQANFKNKTNLIITYSNSKRGEINKKIIHNKYHDIKNKRFDNGFEQKSIISLNLKKKLKNRKLYYKLGLDLIDWKNYMFDPENIEPIKNDNIEKISYNFSIYYNLD